MVPVLLQRGCDYLALDKDNKTAFDLANEGDSDECAAIAVLLMRHYYALHGATDDGRFELRKREKERERERIKGIRDANTKKTQSNHKIVSSSAEEPKSESKSSSNSLLRSKSAVVVGIQRPSSSSSSS